MPQAARAIDEVTAAASVLGDAGRALRSGAGPARSPGTSSPAATGSSRCSTPTGPEPAAGQFYMLAAERGWGWRRRPALSGAGLLGRRLRAARAGGCASTSSSTTSARAPSGSARLEAGERLWITGPLGRPFAPPQRAASRARPGAILVGRRDRRRAAGDLAPAARRRRDSRPGPARLPRRERLRRPRPVRLQRGPARLARTGTPATAATSPTCSAVLLEGDDAASAAVYACGPPAMLEAVRAMCAERGVACELAMEAPMACGFGACFGCAVPLADGGYMRLCVDGPVVRGDEIETALVPGSGH